jgi:hypothetical protein
VNPSVLKKSEEGLPSWFTGKNNCDLYMVEFRGEVVRWEASVFGNRMTWSKGVGLQAVAHIEDEASGKIRYKGSTLEKDAGTPGDSLKRSTATLIDAMEALPDPLKAQILKHLGE